MLEAVFLLLCSLPWIATEFVKTMEFNITIHNDGSADYICTPTRTDQVKLVDGDKMKIVAHIPHSVKYIDSMRCRDRHDKPIEIQLYSIRAFDNGSACVTVNRTYKYTEHGAWKCDYSMAVKRGRDSTASCKFNVIELGQLWFTGLDPERRRIQRNKNSDVYTYTYEMGEALSIHCKPNNLQGRVFQLFNSTSSSKPQTLTSIFEIKASANLNQSHLICRFQDTGGYTQEIKLEFTSGQIWFTGINLNQTSIEQYQDGALYFYKYKPGENVNINCATDMKGGRINLYFHDIGTAIDNLESQSPPFYYAPDHNTNGSYLYCSYLYDDGTTAAYTAALVFILGDYLPAQISTTPLMIVTPTPTTTMATKPTTKTTTKPKIKTIPKTTTATKPTPKTTTKPKIKPIPTTTTATKPTTKTTTKPKIKPSALIEIDIEGKDIVPDEFNTPQKKYYTYTYNESNAKLKLKCVTRSSNRNGKYKLKMESLRNETAEIVADFLLKIEYEVAHIFELLGELGEIKCTSWDADTYTSSTILTATLHYSYKPDTNMLTTVQSQIFVEHNLIYIVPTAAALVIVCGIMCAAVIRKRKNSVPLDDSVNLPDNQQHTYNTLPIPKLRTTIPRKAPAVEGSYSEPKDSNDVSEALYADPRRMDDTYAEPYVQLYAQPIPKSLRKPKIKDDPNYSNAFRKHYVNS